MLLEQFLEQTAARAPDKVALVCEGRRVTYSEIDIEANRIAPRVDCPWGSAR